MTASTRRLFLGSLAGGAALAARSPQPRPGTALPKDRISPLDGVKREKIRIADIKVTNLAYRLKPEEEWPDAASNFIIWKTESVIVGISTDAGLNGIGGATRYNGPAEMKGYLDGIVTAK